MSFLTTSVTRPLTSALKSALTLLLSLSLFLSLAGCTVGPDYQRPHVAVPITYHERQGWSQATPDSAGPKGDWWTGFNDPLLDALEPMVSVSNQTVRQNYYNYQEALALVSAARSGLFPTVSATGSASKARSAAGIGKSGTLEGAVNWAPDFWGEVRRTVEERAASVQASEATLANAKLAEQVALATAVINLRITDANLALLQKTVAAYQDSLRVIGNQNQAGTIAPSDEITARTQLDSAQSSLIALGVARAQYAHAIAVLAGRHPEDLTIPATAALPTLPTIPLVVPSTLLQRRPDIATAERQMAEQNAAIGVAVSAYYPNISLSGLAGLTQSPLSGLLNVGNYVWSLGTNASATLFDGGERSAEVGAARAAYNASVAHYRGTVLSAFQNIEDDLASLRILEQQAVVLASAVTDANRGAQIAFNEYQAGTVDYTTVATAQTTQLSLQQSALSVQQQRLVAAANLIGDLGGGWDQSQLHDGGKVCIDTAAD